MESQTICLSQRLNRHPAQSSPALGVPLQSMKQALLRSMTYLAGLNEESVTSSLKRTAMVCSVLLDTGPRNASQQLSYQVTFGKQTQPKKVTTHQISKGYMFQERLTCKSQILTSPSRHPEAMRPGMVGWKVTHQGVRRCPTKE